MAYPNYGEYEDIKKSSHIEVFHLDLLSENCKMQRGSFIMISFFQNKFKITPLNIMLYIILLAWKNNRGEYKFL